MSWQRDASETRYVWTHKVYENQVRMAVSGKRLRNGQLLDQWQSNNWQSGTHGIVNAGARWDVYVDDSEWSRIDIEASISLSDHAAFTGATLPQDATVSTGIALMARCPRTRWRVLMDAEFSGTPVSLVLPLPKGELSGEVELIPFIFLRDQVAHHQEGYADSAGAILATGFPVSIWVDEPQIPPGSGLRRVWQPFPDDLSDALYQLDFDDDGSDVVPTLYINNDHPTIKAIVDHRGRKQPRAAARDAIFGLMATEVWMQLAAFAADIAAQDLDNEDPRAKFAQKTLRSMAKRIQMNSSDIQAAFEGESGRSGLSAKVQHWLKSAPRQSDLVEAIAAEMASE